MISLSRRVYITQIFLQQSLKSGYQTLVMKMYVMGAGYFAVQ